MLLRAAPPSDVRKVSDLPTRDCGFAAAHRGKPTAYRHTLSFVWEAPPPTEAQPQQEKDPNPESQRLSAMCCGRAASSSYGASNKLFTSGFAISRLISWIIRPLLNFPS
jgi:hypothetical protein